MGTLSPNQNKIVVPETNNAHFNASNNMNKIPVTPNNHSINHRFSQYHSISTPNSSHTPSSHGGTPTSNSSSSGTGTPCSSHSNTPKSKSNETRMDKQNTFNHHSKNNRNNHRIQQQHRHNNHHHHNHINGRSYNSNQRYAYNQYASYNNQQSNAEIVDNTDNKTLFIDNIPIKCTEEAIQSALKRHGSIKSFILKTKQNKTSQYVNVVCFQ